MAGLRQIGAERVVPYVFELLKEDTRKGENEYQALLLILVQLGPTAVQTLVERLEAGDVITRQLAADALGKIGPDYYEGTFDRMGSAEAAVLQRNYRAAIEFVAPILTENPYHIDANYITAYCYLSLQEHRTAIRFLEALLRVLPVDLDPHFHLASAHSLSGNIDEALDNLEGVVDALDNLKAIEDDVRLRESWDYVIEWAKTDPDLESIRGTERYGKLLKRLESSRKRLAPSPPPPLRPR